MPSVFVSHANADKARLLPYILYLLASLDPRVTLWIDKPEGIHPNLGRHPRIHAIDPGTDWLEAIQAASQASACTLVFWSERAAEKDREVMKREIMTALKLNKCIPVRLDQTDIVVFPEILRFEQILDVHRFGLGQDDAELDRVICTLRRFTAGPASAIAPDEQATKREARNTKIGHLEGGYFEGDQNNYLKQEKG